MVAHPIIVGSRCQVCDHQVCTRMAWFLISPHGNSERVNVHRHSDTPQVAIKALCAQQEAEEEEEEGGAQVMRTISNAVLS